MSVPTGGLDLAADGREDTRPAYLCRFLDRSPVPPNAMVFELGADAGSDHEAWGLRA